MVAQQTSRVPAALQQIFLQSQSGADVEKIAPPPQLGFRIFYRSSKDRQSKSKKSLKAPDVNSLYQERGPKRDTAATASIKAIKARSDDSSMSVSPKKTTQCCVAHV
jgi:hypothetical protein